MAKENLSHHQDIEDTQGTNVAAGSGNSSQQTKSSEKSVWITIAAVVLIGAAVALALLL